MLELLTLYPHADYMADSQYNTDGRVINLNTAREPEYSEYLINLIKRCIEPNPSDRIELKQLRSHVKSYRKGIKRTYRNSSPRGKVRFETENRLYYVKNEINDMPTGDFIPYMDKNPSEPESGKFPDREFPVKFPGYDHGSTEIELYGNADDVNPPLGAPEEMPRIGMST